MSAQNAQMNNTSQKSSQQNGLQSVLLRGFLAANVLRKLYLAQPWDYPRTGALFSSKISVPAPEADSGR